MAVFEQVTGRLLAPDGSPLSGSVVFTPAFSFARDTQAVTLPAPVTVQLDAEGRVAASLQVPDESTQPTTWTWKACPRLRHAGASVGLEPFVFELVKGQPVNLAEALPVPDPVTGEYVTQGKPGAAGVGLSAITAEGGDLVFTLTDGSQTRVPMPQSLPVPVAVPAMQDTGWRDISMHITATGGLGNSRTVGTWKIRRVGPLVEVVAAEVVASQQLNAPFPAGFTGQHLRNRPGDNRPEVIVYGGRITTINLLTNNSSVQGLRSLWTTTDPWPTDLPGNPA